MDIPTILLLALAVIVVLRIAVCRAWADYNRPFFSASGKPK